MRLALILAVTLLAACVPSTGTPPAPAPTDAPTSSPLPPAPPPDAGSSQTALQLCLANFEALNPDVPPATIQQIFCNTPEDLAPWARQVTLKRSR